MKLSEVRANPRKFWLGPVEHIHEIGEYAFVEYRREGGTAFAIFIESESVGRSAATLDDAMVTAIAYKFDGLNSQAAYFFRRMIGDAPDASYLAHCDRAKRAE